MKILNLYSGIGGNRKLWGDSHEITAVELKPEIGKIYQDFFPNDKVIIADAHQFLLEHFEEYDFIWSSPPCPTHSQLRWLRTMNKEHEATGQYSPPEYPDMSLYQEVIFLQHFYKGKWVVENVIAYYEPLIKPFIVGRHWFWSNFYIPDMQLEADNIDKGLIKDWEERFGFDLSRFAGVEKRTILRNCVVPELGRHILNYALNPIKLQQELFLI